MTICTIIITLVTCTQQPGTKVSPAEAARILAPRAFVYVAPTSTVTTNGAVRESNPDEPILVRGYVRPPQPNPVYLDTTLTGEPLIAVSPWLLHAYVGPDRTRRPPSSRQREKRR